MTDETFYTGVCGEHAGLSEPPAGCGESFALRARSITVVRWGGARRHWEWQVFGSCPHCGNTVLGHFLNERSLQRKPLEVVRLIGAGANVMEVDRSPELDEPARFRSCSPFDGEDLLQAHVLLEDDEWLAGVIGVLAKKYGGRR